MPTFHRLEEIEAWQLARALCQRIITISKETGLARDFKLRDQIRASSRSIMDNIAEGFGRGGNAEFVQFLEVAHGSAAETQSQLYQLLDCEYINDVVFNELYIHADHTSGKILKLIQYLNSSPIRGPRFNKK
jgi:four helix bundle protein